MLLSYGTDCEEVLLLLGMIHPDHGSICGLPQDGDNMELMCV